MKALFAFEIIKTKQKLLKIFLLLRYNYYSVYLIFYLILKILLGQKKSKYHLLPLDKDQ